MKRPVVIILLAAALLLVLVGIGAVIFFTANAGFPTNNPFDVRNISSELEESKTLKVDTDKPLILNVADDAGDITITQRIMPSRTIGAIRRVFSRLARNSPAMGNSAPSSQSGCRASV